MKKIAIKESRVGHRHKSGTKLNNILPSGECQLALVATSGRGWNVSGNCHVHDISNTFPRWQDSWAAGRSGLFNRNKNQIAMQLQYIIILFQILCLDYLPASISWLPSLLTGLPSALIIVFDQSESPIIHHSVRLDHLSSFCPLPLLPRWQG